MLNSNHTKISCAALVLVAASVISACGSVATTGLPGGQTTPTATATIAAAPFCSATSPRGAYCETQAQANAHTEFLHMATVPDSVFLAQGDELLAPSGPATTSGAAASTTAENYVAQRWPLAKLNEIVLADNVKIGGTSATASLQWVVSMVLPSGVTLPAVPANVPANHAGLSQFSHTYIIVWVSADTGEIDGVVTVQQ